MNDEGAEHHLSPRARAAFLQRLAHDLASQARTDSRVMTAITVTGGWNDQQWAGNASRMLITLCTRALAGEHHDVLWAMQRVTAAELRTVLAVTRRLLVQPGMAPLTG
jgi:hypothetical protein